MSNHLIFDNWIIQVIMNIELYLKNLTTPKGEIDVILDTDAYNEIDDQFAIAYMLANSDRLHVKGICAAPFLNTRSVSPADGMEKSYNEILKLLDLAGEEQLKDRVYRGSETYLENEETPVESEAADYIANTANAYSPEKPLYIVAIGAITNVASAILKNPNMKENVVVVWLGGHGRHIPDAATEFNMKQDIAGARVVMGCGIPLVQLPCEGVVERFLTTGSELEFWLKGKNKLCDYLVENTIEEAEKWAKGRPWSRVIWDVTAVAWLLNSNARFMKDRICVSPIPEYDGQYGMKQNGHFIKYVYQIDRDALFKDLFERLGGRQ